MVVRRLAANRPPIHVVAPPLHMFLALALTALTGVLRATEQLHGVSDLWTTSYGLVLLVKAVGVGIMLLLSLAWRRGFPAARAEAAAAIVVVAATAVLAAYPNQA